MLCIQEETAPVADRIAQAMIEANAEGYGATREVLLGLGFSAKDLDEHGPDAECQARDRFVQRVDRPAYDRNGRVNAAARSISHLMPAMPEVTMHLQARGFAKAELDDILAEAIATAADAFAHQAGAQ